MKQGPRSHWDKEKDAKLLRLVAAGLSWSEVATHFKGLKRDAMRKRWTRLTETPAQKADRLERRRIYKFKKRNQRTDGIDDTFVIHISIPQEVLADREVRMNALPPSLTAAFFGDPPAGFSALDRKVSEASA